MEALLKTQTRLSVLLSRPLNPSSISYDNLPSSTSPRQPALSHSHSLDCTFGPCMKEKRSSSNTFQKKQHQDQQQHNDPPIAATAAAAAAIRADSSAQSAAGLDQRCLAIADEKDASGVVSRNCRSAVCGTLSLKSGDAVESTSGRVLNNELQAREAYEVRPSTESSCAAEVDRVESLYTRDLVLKPNHICSLGEFCVSAESASHTVHASAGRGKCANSCYSAAVTGIDAASQEESSVSVESSAKNLAAASPSPPTASSITVTRPSKLTGITAIAAGRAIEKKTASVQSFKTEADFVTLSARRNGSAVDEHALRSSSNSCCSGSMQHLVSPTRSSYVGFALEKKTAPPTRLMLNGAAASLSSTFLNEEQTNVTEAIVAAKCIEAAAVASEAALASKVHSTAPALHIKTVTESADLHAVLAAAANGRPSTNAPVVAGSCEAEAVHSHAAYTTDRNAVAFESPLVRPTAGSHIEGEAAEWGKRASAAGESGAKVMQRDEGSDISKFCSETQCSLVLLPSTAGAIDEIDSPAEDDGDTCSSLLKEIGLSENATQLSHAAYSWTSTCPPSSSSNSMFSLSLDSTYSTSLCLPLEDLATAKAESSSCSAHLDCKKRLRSATVPSELYKPVHEKARTRSESTSASFRTFLSATAAEMELKASAAARTYQHSAVSTAIMHGPTADSTDTIDMKETGGGAAEAAAELGEPEVAAAATGEEESDPAATTTLSLSMTSDEVKGASETLSRAEQGREAGCGSKDNIGNSGMNSSSGQGNDVIKNHADPLIYISESEKIPGTEECCPNAPCSPQSHSLNSLLRSDRMLPIPTGTDAAQEGSYANDMKPSNTAPVDDYICTGGSSVCSIASGYVIVSPMSSAPIHPGIRKERLEEPLKEACATAMMDPRFLCVSDLSGTASTASPSTLSTSSPQSLSNLPSVYSTSASSDTPSFGMQLCAALSGYRTESSDEAAPAPTGVTELSLREQIAAGANAAVLSEDEDVLPAAAAGVNNDFSLFDVCHRSSSAESAAASGTVWSSVGSKESVKSSEKKSEGSARSRVDSKKTSSTIRDRESMSEAANTKLFRPYSLKKVFPRKSFSRLKRALAAAFSPSTSSRKRNGTTNALQHANAETPTAPPASFGEIQSQGKVPEEEETTALHATTASASVCETSPADPLRYHSGSTHLTSTGNSCAHSSSPRPFPTDRTFDKMNDAQTRRSWEKTRRTRAFSLPVNRSGAPQLLTKNAHIHKAEEDRVENACHSDELRPLHQLQLQQQLFEGQRVLKQVEQSYQPSQQQRRLWRRALELQESAAEERGGNGSERRASERKEVQNSCSRQFFTGPTSSAASSRSFLLPPLSGVCEEHQQWLLVKQERQRQQSLEHQERQLQLQFRGGRSTPSQLRIPSLQQQLHHKEQRAQRRLRESLQLVCGESSEEALVDERSAEGPLEQNSRDVPFQVSEDPYICWTLSQQQRADDGICYNSFFPCSFSHSPSSPSSPLLLRRASAKAAAVETAMAAAPAQTTADVAAARRSSQSPRVVHTPQYKSHFHVPAPRRQLLIDSTASEKRGPTSDLSGKDCETGWERSDSRVLVCKSVSSSSRREETVITTTATPNAATDATAAASTRKTGKAVSSARVTPLDSVDCVFLTPPHEDSSLQPSTLCSPISQKLRAERMGDRQTAKKQTDRAASCAPTDFETSHRNHVLNDGLQVIPLPPEAVYQSESSNAAVHIAAAKKAQWVALQQRIPSICGQNSEEASCAQEPPSSPAELSAVTDSTKSEFVTVASIEKLAGAERRPKRVFSLPTESEKMAFFQRQNFLHKKCGDRFANMYTEEETAEIERVNAAGCEWKSQLKKSRERDTTLAIEAAADAAGAYRRACERAQEQPQILLESELSRGVVRTQHRFTHSEAVAASSGLDAAAASAAQSFTSSQLQQHNPMQSGSDAAAPTTPSALSCCIEERSKGFRGALREKQGYGVAELSSSDLQVRRMLHRRRTCESFENLSSADSGPQKRVLRASSSSPTAETPKETTPQQPGKYCLELSAARFFGTDRLVPNYAQAPKVQRRSSNSSSSSSSSRGSVSLNGFSDEKRNFCGRALRWWRAAHVPTRPRHRLVSRKLRVFLLKKKRRRQLEEKLLTSLQRRRLLRAIAMNAAAENEEYALRSLMASTAGLYCYPGAAAFSADNEKDVPVGTEEFERRPHWQAAAVAASVEAAKGAPVVSNAFIRSIAATDSPELQSSDTSSKRDAGHCNFHCFDENPQAQLETAGYYTAAGEDSGHCCSLFSVNVLRQRHRKNSRQQPRQLEPTQQRQVQQLQQPLLLHQPIEKRGRQGLLFGRWICGHLSSYVRATRAAVSQSSQYSSKRKERSSSVLIDQLVEEEYNDYLNTSLSYRVLVVGVGLLLMHICHLIWRFYRTRRPLEETYKKSNAAWIAAVGDCIHLILYGILTLGGCFMVAKPHLETWSCVCMFLALLVRLCTLTGVSFFHSEGAARSIAETHSFERESDELLAVEEALSATAISSQLVQIALCCTFHLVLSSILLSVRSIASTSLHATHIFGCLLAAVFAGFMHPQTLRLEGSLCAASGCLLAVYGFLTRTQFEAVNTEYSQRWQKKELRERLRQEKETNIQRRRTVGDDEDSNKENLLSSVLEQNQLPSGRTAGVRDTDTKKHELTILERLTALEDVIVTAFRTNSNKTSPIQRENGEKQSSQCKAFDSQDNKRLSTISARSGTKKNKEGHLTKNSERDDNSFNSFSGMHHRILSTTRSTHPHLINQDKKNRLQAVLHASRCLGRPNSSNGGSSRRCQRPPRAEWWSLQQKRRSEKKVTGQKLLKQLKPRFSSCDQQSELGFSWGSFEIKNHARSSQGKCSSVCVGGDRRFKEWWIDDCVDRFEDIWGRGTLQQSAGASGCGVVQASSGRGDSLDRCSLLVQEKTTLGRSHSVAEKLHNCISSFAESVLVNALEKIGVDWNLDFFKFDDMVDGNSLRVTAEVQLLPLIQPDGLHCDAQVIRRFAHCVQQQYRPQNPYHNQRHASMVSHSCMVIVRESLPRRGRLSLVDEIALCVAALAHDMGHPGVTNQYLISSQSKLATTYNDISVLENYHAACCFRTAGLCNDLNIFKNLSKETYQYVRQNIIGLILATDMGRHMFYVTRLRARTEKGQFMISRDADRWLFFQACIKAADLSHSATEWKQHRRWSKCICEEFYVQGDEERRQGLPVLEIFDRKLQHRFPQSQYRFLKVVVEPLLHVIVKLESLLQGKGGVNRVILKHFLRNREVWKMIADEGSTAAAVYVMEEDRIEFLLKQRSNRYRVSKNELSNEVEFQQDQ